jgi:prevent-host-death family protein
MSVQISVTEARASLPELIDQVLAGEEVTITRHGKPVVVMVQPDALRVRRTAHLAANVERIRELMDRGRTEPMSKRGGLTPAEAEALVADVRRSRESR